jgi:mono/diheme cytochrome c family protein
MSELRRSVGQVVRGARFSVLTFRLITVAVIAALTASCTTLDRAVGLVPLFTTMRDQVAVRPFEGPVDSLGRHRFLPPAGSVPTTGREDSLDLFTRDLREIPNPVTPTTETLVHGRQIYNTYCGVCHGPTGGGDGPVAQKLLGIVPALTTDQAKARSDGYLYAIVRHGRGAMPAYGDRIRDRTERWYVVNYVRNLQGM